MVFQLLQHDVILDIYFLAPSHNLLAISQSLGITSRIFLVASIDNECISALVLGGVGIVGMR